MKIEMSKRTAYKNCDMITFDAKTGTAPLPTTVPLARDAAAKTIGGYGAGYDVKVATGLSATPGTVT
jgi:hypothetical protein